MEILIRGGRLIDAASQTDRTGDILIRDGKIWRIQERITPSGHEDYVLDAGGKAVIPGIVDMHVHFRDPGQTQKEDYQSGSMAAARGGVTTVVAMPNTTPVIDTAEKLRACRKKAADIGMIHILQAGSMTMGEQGTELADIAGMAQAGVKAVSEDGKSVMDASLAREAFRKAAENGLLILDHCEDIGLRGDGCMNLDANSARLSLPGISNSVEDTISARDMILAAETGARLHLCHVSTRGVVQMLRFARSLGYSVTAEACPHHFILSSDDIRTDDPDYKMNPPLRTPEDVQELRRGLADGTISVISTDHAPHTREDKAGSMRTAAFGIVGLETSFSLSYTALVRSGILTPLALVEKMCYNPARLLGLDCGRLQDGAPADIMIADLEHPYSIDRSRFRSKGRNTPFDGWKVYGKTIYTICDGRILYDSEADR